MTICGISNTSIEHIIISWSILLSNRVEVKHRGNRILELEFALGELARFFDQEYEGVHLGSTDTDTATRDGDTGYGTRGFVNYQSVLDTGHGKKKEVFERSSNHPGTPNQSFGVVKICYLYSLSSSLRFLIHVGLQRYVDTCVYYIYGGCQECKESFILRALCSFIG
ncbi:uncharacterized protein LOC141668891 isoform X3 [Apium graveolens]|uniref:uncharacterized protein LOC141668891 isoform X3 n=1 Tax=Apium graveolens TaxID=4045 RepID=UPI003D7B6DFB